MNYPMYPRTRSNKKHDSVMVEKEISFLSVPRKPRRKIQEEPSEKEKDLKIEIVEPPTTSKQINEILQRMERDVQGEPL